MTISAAVTSYLEWSGYVRGIAPSSAKLYGWYLGRFAALAGPQRPLGACCGAAEDFLRAMGRRGCGEHARAKAFQILRAFFRWACERGHAGGNPLAGARAPIIHDGIRPAVGTAQARRLMAAVLPHGWRGLRDRGLIAVMAFAGLRCGETRRLRPEDLDFQRGTIRVVGKGGKIAEVPLHPQLAALLGEYLKVRPPADFLFPSCGGGHEVFGQLDNERVEFLLRTVYGPRAGLKDATPHALRRGFAQELRRRGVPIEHIRRLLRHSKIDTTMIYLREAGMDELRGSIGRL